MSVEDALAALGDYKKATKAEDVDAQDAASDRFQDAIEDVEEPEFSKMMEAYNKMIEGEAAVVFAEYGKIAKEIAGLGYAFDLGAKMAEEGKGELFFPYLAAELSEIAGVMAKLRELTEEVISQVDDLPARIRARDVEGLIDEGAEARQAVQDLIDKLEELRNEFDS